jgi:hypothetical protein
MKLRFDVPFPSGQIRVKCLKSSDGRSLSIGMQYLSSNPCEFVTVDTKRNKPYSMQSILQSVLPRLTTDKILHGLQLFFTTGLESARVMKNITAVICEDQLVLDIVLAALQAGTSGSAIIQKNKRAQPPV